MKLNNGIVCCVANNKLCSYTRPTFCLVVYSLNENSQENQSLPKCFLQVRRREGRPYLGVLQICYQEVKDGLIEKAATVHSCHYSLICRRSFILCLPVSVIKILCVHSFGVSRPGVRLVPATRLPVWF